MFKRPISRTILLAGGGVLAVSLGTRYVYDQATKRAALSLPVHPDASEVSIGVTSQLKEEATVLLKGEGGNTVVISNQAFSKLVHEQVQEMEGLKARLKKEASKRLTDHLDPIFEDVEKRSDRFANWYFAYSTTFKLLREATASAARHALSVGRGESLGAAVATDLEGYLSKKYERIVLQPEITDGQLRHAYQATVGDVHSMFAAGVSKMQREFVQELSHRTTHLQAPKSVTLSLDWVSQLHKIKAIPAQYEKMPEMTVALSAGGAIAGKAVGAAAGKVSANAFVSKLAAPFVTKALGPGVGAVAGSVAGPLGSFAGAAIGVGIDYTATKGVEILQREDFIKDVHAVVRTTRRDYQSKMEGELHRAATVWVDDAVQLLLITAREQGGT